MYVDDWRPPLAFVLLVVIGALAGYRATLPTGDFLALGPQASTLAAAPAKPGAAAAAAPSSAATSEDASASAPAVVEAASTTQAPAPETTVASLEPGSAPVLGQADAMESLQQAANAGDSRAQYALGLAYKLGRGVEADKAQSLLWMRRAAPSGLPAAARTLGIAYEEGLGVDKDPAEASKWYTRAALGGDLQAMHNLAYFFTQGLGGLPRDGAQAEHWFQLAAERGLVASQINLAILCSQGDQWGIETRLSDAYFWSGVAAQKGDQQAKRMHDVFSRVFTPKEKAKLDGRITAFKSKPIDVIANGGFDTSPEAFLPAASRPELSDSELTAARQLLTQLGFGGDGEQSIREFQSAYGLQETGKADRELLAALKTVAR